MDQAYNRFRSIKDTLQLPRFNILESGTSLELDGDIHTINPKRMSHTLIVEDHELAYLDTIM